MERQENSQIISEYAALLSATEITVGSIVHSLHIPFGGQLLSINQGFLLTCAIKNIPTTTEASKATLEISGVSSILKSLSPAGKKLTPMLAIFMQGFLYSIGIMLFGINSLGVAIASILLASWAFVQSVVVAYIIFGTVIFEGIYKIWNELSSLLNLQENLIWWAIGLFVILKVFISISINLVAFKNDNSILHKYLLKISHLNTHKIKNKNSFLKYKWLFIGLILNIFILFNFEQINTQTIWVYIMRPLAVVWLIGFIFENLPDKIRAWVYNKFPRMEKVVNKLGL